jgi:hypothetical protein
MLGLGIPGLIEGNRRSLHYATLPRHAGAGELTSLFEDRIQRFQVSSADLSRKLHPVLKQNVISTGA